MVIAIPNVAYVTVGYSGSLRVEGITSCFFESVELVVVMSGIFCAVEDGRFVLTLFVVLVTIVVGVFHVVSAVEGTFLVLIAGGVFGVVSAVEGTFLVLISGGIFGVVSAVEGTFFVLISGVIFGVVSAV